MPDEENSEGKFRLGKSERMSRQMAKLKYNPQDCKWKEKVAALGRDTCRFLPQIVRKVALSITQHEEILAVIPNEEALHCHHFERYDTLPVSPSGRINETGATHDQTP